MKKVFLFIILFISTLTVRAQFPITLSGYPLSTTGWVYGAGSTGVGPTVVDSTVRLTTTVTSEANYLYYNTPVTMANYCQWQADFDFQITVSSSGVADGLAFWFLSNPPSSGTTGSSIGLPSYPNGLILVLDTYNNVPPSDCPLETLLGYNGTESTYVEDASTGTLCPLVGSQSFITNGAWHHVTVTYNLGTINVYFNYSTTASLSGYYDLSGYTGKFGFSASTGAVYSTQKVKRVNIVASTCLTVENSGPVCEGDSLNLFAIGDSVGATYAWTGPGGFTSTAQDPVILYPTIADTGTYMVIRTGTGIDTGYTHVVIKPKPVVTATNNSTICQGSDLIFTAAPDSTGETFSWTGPNAFTSAVENPTITGATQIDTGYYTVIATLNGCYDTSTTHVDIIYVAVPTAANNGPICSGDSIVLTSTDAVTGVSYSWAGPGGYTSAVQNPVIHAATTANSGIYTVTATIGICSQTATTTVQVNPIPPEPTVPPFLPVCSGTTLNLSATDTAGAAYHWSGPNGWSSGLQNPSIPTVITAATGVYSVFVTLAGCVSPTYTVNITVDSTPQTPTAGNNGPLCTGATLDLTSFCATTGVSYHWVGPGGSFTSTLQDPSITNVLTTMGGTYTVTVKSGVCTNTATTNVIIYQTPGLPTVSNNGPVCAGALLQLTSVATPGSGTYYWTGPNSFTSTIEDPAISNVTLSASGTYYVYEVLNGCTSPTDSTIAVILPSPAVPVVSSNTPICQGDTILLYSHDDSVVTFSWSGPASYTSTDENPVILNAVPAQTGLYILTVTQGTCTAQATVSVNVTATPSLTVANNGPICAGDTLKLYANSDPGVTYHWGGPFGLNVNSQNPMVYPTILENAGIYTVTATTSVATGACGITAYDTVVINPSPDAPWVTWLTFCQFYNAPPMQAVDATNVLWYTSAAGGVGTTTPPVPTTNVPGVFYFYLNQTVNGCTSPIDSIQVTVNPKPVVTVAPATSFVCPHQPVTLTATDADPLDTYHWYPATYLTDTLSAVTISNPVTDVHYIAVVENHFGCTDTGSAQITVYPAGVIDMAVGDSVTLYPGQSFHIQPITNCTSLTWFPPAGLDATNISDPTATPTISTMYTATGITENGCVVMDSIYFHVSDETIFAIPNAFTPGTGINNTIRIFEEGMGTLNYFRIFDRWGVLVFETHNIADAWDGNYKGQPQPMGVYVYEIQGVSSKTGKLINMRGNITLLR